MDRRTVAAGLIAALAIACSESEGVQSDGSGGGRSLLGGIANLSGQGGDGDGDGDNSADSGSDGSSDGRHMQDSGVPDQHDASSADDAADETPDSSGPEPCEDADRDGICDGSDDCIAPNAAPDDDYDGLPNVCDDCPVGASGACDTLLWEIERIDVKYSDESVIGYVSQLVLAQNEGPSRFVRVGRPLEQAQTTQELDANDLAEVQTLFDDLDTNVAGQIQFSENLNGALFLGEPWVGPIVPYGIAPGRVYVRRVVVTGRATSSGTASATWQIRGYLRPF